jgi:opacity protein-like surface antigen
LILFLLLFLPVLAAAQVAPAVYLDAGMSRTHDIDPTFFFTARARWYFNNYVSIEPDFGYWKSNKAGQVCNAGKCTDLALRDADAGLSLVINDPLWERAALYFGGGIAAHMRKGDISATEQKSQTRFGGQAFVGLDYHITDTLGLDIGVRTDLVRRKDNSAEHQLKIFAGLRINI